MSSENDPTRNQSTSAESRPSKSRTFGSQVHIHTLSTCTQSMYMRCLSAMPVDAIRRAPRPGKLDFPISRDVRTSRRLRTHRKRAVLAGDSCVMSAMGQRRLSADVSGAMLATLARWKTAVRLIYFVFVYVTRVSIEISNASHMRSCSESYGMNGSVRNGRKTHL